ncbi:YeeE/YedE thiosulfate transporter family protein [Erythrobacter sp. NE805]|uniref:YeeE/YedE thiosulfate transporter family protein n=1 Tax=Erythrobacter sp. NE805 TaxID=3389875 RepID=UPI00396B2C47
MSGALTVILLFLIGYASQRSGVCMVRAVREVIARRRVHRLAGFSLAAGAAMLVMGLAEMAGARPFATILGSPPDALAVAGGVVFGLGSLLAGHCAMGLLAALTNGELPRLGSILAMFVAAALLGPDMSKAALLLPPRDPLASPLAGHPGLALTLGTIIAITAGSYIYRRIGWKRPKGGWSPLLAMSLIGTASGLLFALDRHWVYTSRIAEIARGGMAGTAGTALGLAVLVAGMGAASVAEGTFRLETGTLRGWARAFASGLLMGLGATMVPGGNDAMLFTGVPLLLPNLLAAYAAFAATLFAALMLRSRVVPAGA